MSMQWQKIEVPLNAGLNEKGKPEALPNGPLVVAQNLHQARTGSVGKRNGVTALTQRIIAGLLGGNIPAGDKIFGYRDAVCQIGQSGVGRPDGRWAFMLSPSATAWNFIDRPPEPTCYRVPIASGDAQILWFDCCMVNGYLAVSWAASSQTSGGNGSGYVSLLDPANGYARVCNDFLIASTANPFIRLCALSKTLILTYMDTAHANVIRFGTLDTTSDTTISAGISIGTLGTSRTPATNKFDVVAGSTWYYVAYVTTSAGANNVAIDAFNASQVLQVSTAVTTTAAAPDAVAIAGSQSNVIWLAYNDGAGSVNCKVIGNNPTTLVTSVAIATVIAVSGGEIPKRLTLQDMFGTGVPGTSPGELQCTTDAGHTYWCKFSNLAGTVTPTTQREAFWAATVTKPFTFGGRIYQGLMHVDSACGVTSVPVMTAGYPSQSQMALCDITDGQFDAVSTPRPVAFPAAHLINRQLSGFTDVVPSIVAVSTGKYACPISVKTSTAAGDVGTGGPNSFASTLEICFFDFNASSQWMVPQLGDQTLLSGGAPWWFDGKAMAECGFFNGPVITNQALVAGGSQSTVTYSYCAIYEQVDAQGNVHWSPPSNVVTSTPAAGNLTTKITVTTPQITNRANTANGPRIVLYRHVAGGVFQRVPGSETYSASKTVDILDSNGDSFVDKQPPLYTESGAVVRQSPSSLNVLIAHGDRFVGIDDSRRAVWFTGQKVYGEAPWFSSAFQFPLDTEGYLTALGSLDGRLYVFTADRIYYVDGSGPSDNGNGAYGIPVQIPTGGVGCINPLSVLTTAQGLYFQSSQGVYLLTRANELQFIGSGVEQSVLAMPLITSAIEHGPTGKCYFSALNGVGSDTGSRFVYDYIHGVWSIDDIAANGDQVGFISAVMIGGALSGSPLYYGLQSTGIVFTENTGTGLDNGAWQPTVIETGWLKLDGEQGYWRVRNVALLVDLQSRHNITMSVYYNYATSPTDVRTWTDTEINSLVTNREQIAISCTQQKVEAIKVRIEDAGPSSFIVGNGRGGTFLGLAFEVGMKGGRFRLPAANEK